MGESALSLNHKVSKKYNVNFAFRSRYFLYNINELQYKQQQLDVFHFSTYNINSKHKLSLGAYYRNRAFFETGSDELRFMEQFSASKKINKIRLRHRFRAEQRILETKTIFRQRYRFAVDLPLVGNTLDIGEPFLMSALEGLWSLKEVSAPEIDSRTTIFIGWQLAKTLKFQTGLEHRFEALNISAKNYLFLLTSAILKI
nr:DUF2490 domain-containing protein [Pseudalgibacter alginicilyticus]